MIKDYSESLLEARKALDAAENRLRGNDYSEALYEMKQVVIYSREVTAWINHNLDMEHMKNGN